MKDGFVRVAAGTPDIKVSNCRHNSEQISVLMKKAALDNVKLLILPELCITGYTCADLFLQHSLLLEAERQLEFLIEQSSRYDMLIAVGCPIRAGNKLFNCACILNQGQILGVIPKSFIPDYSEFYESRHFSTADKANIDMVQVAGRTVPFGVDLLFECSTEPDFIVGFEICEDLWVPNSPSTALSLGGATIIGNLSATPEYIGKREYRRRLVSMQSAKNICAYVYSATGSGESTTDLVYSGHSIICENGTLLSEAKPDYKNAVDNSLLCADVDVRMLRGERRKMSTFSNSNLFRKIQFKCDVTEYSSLLRTIDQHPFVPHNTLTLDERCNEILGLQSTGLRRRLLHTKAKAAVVALSGGLDSTLALLVANEAVMALHRDDCKVIAITMPGAGTTDRTFGNTQKICDSLNIELRKIPIVEAFAQHLKDIGHSAKPDTVFENAQARERMQIAMDVANMENGLVVSTGDMSELALGFTTYNGDHMSMYGVNSGVPKTLVKHIISYYAQNGENKNLRDVLLDVVATPVSPELLPLKEGEMGHQTEDILGPYELHDFFLYYMVRFGFEPAKIFRLAKIAFDGKYEAAFIKNCIQTFYKRFFMSQFKRSCLPDGVKIGTVSLSPRGDWRMPSDADAEFWMLEVGKL